MRNFHRRARGHHVAVDVECAGPYLRCVGFWDRERGAGLVAHFRAPGGRPALRGQELRQLVEAVGELLADPEVLKVFQNGQAFDVPYLTELGFEVQGYDFDTLLAQHLVWPELPKGLEFLGKVYAGLPGWKHLLGSPDEEGEGK